jgi:hypothetical protein
LKAGYTPVEIGEVIANSPFNNEEIDFYLAWMFIKVSK